MLKALPSVGQLDHGLSLSPQRLRRNKTLEVKRLFPREQVIHGTAQLVGEHGQRLGFAVLVFEGGNIRFSGLALPNKEYGGFRKRPAEMHIANLFAGRP